MPAPTVTEPEGNCLVCGMSFGDEGKGSFTDWLTDDGQTLIVRYNGGAQAAHTVTMADGRTHCFAQLGSGMFHPGCSTLLDKNTVADPYALAVECQVFSGKCGMTPQQVLDRVAVHEDCLTVTRLHRCMNRVEMEQTGALRGSVGTGVSTAARVFEEQGVALRFGEMLRGGAEEALPALQELLAKQLESRPCRYSAALQAEIDSVAGPRQLRRLLDEYKRLLDVCRFDVIGNSTAHSGGRRVILEGTQGLLLDKIYGTRPQTTWLDTTALNGRRLFPEARCIGVVKAFSTRHGPGVFPTEDDGLSRVLEDRNQEHGKYNGSLRFGWFDAVLLRYAQSVNRADCLFISCMDRLEAVGRPRICAAYDYSGPRPDGFDGLFRWEPRGGVARILDIRRMSSETVDILRRCVPVYEELPDWGRLGPERACRGFAEAVERCTGMAVAAVSMGPAAGDKLIYG